MAVRVMEEARARNPRILLDSLASTDLTRNRATTSSRQDWDRRSRVGIN